MEHATVYGNSYGILKSELLGKLRAGKDVLLNVDVQGAATIRGQAETEPELKRALVTCFPDAAVHDGAGSAAEKARADSPAVIQKRLAVARQEIAQWKNFDYLLISGRRSRRICGGRWRLSRRKKCGRRVRNRRNFDR
jgi:guanylate kinase